MTTWHVDFEGKAPSWNLFETDEEHVRGRFFREVVEATTARRVSTRRPTAVPCIGAAEGCTGRVLVRRVPRKKIVEWSCEVCGDGGTVTGYRGTEADLSRHIPRGKTYPWLVNDEERLFLLGITTHIPGGRAMVSRAEGIAASGAAFVMATLEELNAMEGLLEALADCIHEGRHREVLDALQGSLYTAIVAR